MRIFVVIDKTPKKRHEILDIYCDLFCEFDTFGFEIHRHILNTVTSELSELGGSSLENPHKMQMANIFAVRVGISLEIVFHFIGITFNVLLWVRVGLGCSADPQLVPMQ